MHDVFIGIDASKDVLDYAFHFKGKLEYFGKFGNTNKQIKKVFAMLAEHFGSADFSAWIVCLENTGVYSKRLLRVMLEHEIACVEQDPKAIKYYFSQARGKTDQWAPYRIAQYVFEMY